ncbi:DUF2188 domain-containing protein [Bacillus sp. NP157]|nr:DUF2188 domain-containing protein [Bacillus sp. NP157]
MIPTPQAAKALAQILFFHVTRTARSKSSGHLANAILHNGVGLLDAPAPPDGHSRPTLPHPHAMLVFDIPLSPPSETWHVSHPDGQCHTFSARHAAVCFAAKLAARLDHVNGGAYLSIEGADGKWRLFTPELKAPV